MASYSTIALIKKLGIKSKDKILLINNPKDYKQLARPWPSEIDQIEFEEAADMDFVHFFTTKRIHLEINFPQLKQKLKTSGVLWISWPKGKSKLSKDFNGNDVRNIGLQN